MPINKSCVLICKAIKQRKEERKSKVRELDNLGVKKSEWVCIERSLKKYSLKIVYFCTFNILQFLYLKKQIHYWVYTYTTRTLTYTDEVVVT